jgi:XTP/dITP diphosphohydrolase
MNKKKIVFATNNQHKIKEIHQAISDEFTILNLKEIGFYEDIEEPFDTLEENAQAKTSTIYNRMGYNCFADDTGLEIDALQGKPGVFSARYAGPEGNPENNIKKVLKEMEGVANRSARFRTVISLILEGEEYFFEGKVEGEILTSKHGAGGFGYDPVFKPKGYSQSFAEMPLELKNTISHRGKAVKKLVEFLRKLQLDNQ